ncbi:hypothetical protein [Tenacibaculum caenipelagi]|uniref:Peptidase C39-like protein n=1 Tax=Tenacibaculum caenipelagi TaxID=1325435 RepID=A0A4R6TD89_9FLAO|nr:hypothetical protein [Tenacibaculum caenipelagi]TDQ22760.1 hypothetical protein DFQ07_2778 [Tenacibaculum caenipelagi]
MKTTEFKAQPYLSKKCGQTCLAMITGKSIEEICKELGKEYYTNIVNDLQAYLEENGYKTLLSNGSFEVKNVPNNSIIRLEKLDESGHFIIKNEIGKIYDPNIGIVEKYMNDTKITHYLNFVKVQKKTTQ